MEQTVIGIFRTAKDVQCAAEQLRHNGFSNQVIDVDVQSADATGIVDTNELYVRDSEHDYAGDSIGRFFRSLFDNMEEAEKFTLVARRNSVLAVTAHSEEEAARAKQILDTCGAIDIDEYVNDLHDANDLSRHTDTEVSADRAADGGRFQNSTLERPVGGRLPLGDERVRGEESPGHGPITEGSRSTFPEGEHKED